MKLLISFFVIVSITVAKIDEGKICKQLTEENFKFIQETYAEGVHEDGEAVFEAWRKTLSNLGRFLSENEFEWDMERRIFLYFCFSPDGTIEYVFYNIQGNEPLEAEEEFKHYTSEFAKTWEYPLTAEIPFAQCGTAVFTPRSRVEE